MEINKDDYGSEVSIIKFSAVHKQVQEQYCGWSNFKNINKKEDWLAKPSNQEVNQRFISVEYGQTLCHTLLDELSKYYVNMSSKTSKKLERYSAVRHTITIIAVCILIELFQVTKILYWTDRWIIYEDIFILHA